MNYTSYKINISLKMTKILSTFKAGGVACPKEFQKKLLYSRQMGR